MALWQEFNLDLISLKCRVKMLLGNKDVLGKRFMCHETDPALCERNSATVCLIFHFSMLSVSHTVTLQ